MQKVAMITGVSGQDGSYLADLLLKKGYVVYGIKRKASSFNTQRVDHLVSNVNFRLLYGDVTDLHSIVTAVLISKPDELYNLAAQSHVKVSFDLPMLFD